MTNHFSPFNIPDIPGVPPIVLPGIPGIPGIPAIPGIFAGTPDIPGVPEGTYLFDAQVHAPTVNNVTEFVERGQLMKLEVENWNAVYGN